MCSVNGRRVPDSGRTTTFESQLALIEASTSNEKECDYRLVKCQEGASASHIGRLEIDCLYCSDLCWERAYLRQHDDIIISS